MEITMTGQIVVAYAGNIHANVTISQVAPVTGKTYKIRGVFHAPNGRALRVVAFPNPGYGRPGAPALLWQVGR